MIFDPRGKSLSYCGILSLATTHPFTPETLALLESRGYKYLVLNRAKQVAYAQKEAIPEETLTFLGLEQFKISTITHYQFLKFSWVVISME